MEGQKHPRESEALRPKVVEALKVVRMRKRMTKKNRGRSGVNPKRGALMAQGRKDKEGAHQHK